MSDQEEDNFCFFGKPLEPYDEDAFPKKRPITVEEQIATDAQGRRRFHGAFTGGFSAGFYNTVGSLEGWTPSEFKSTRQDKAQNKVQKPEDFMDDEDVGEFGIAPQTVKATKDYATSKKRKKQVFSDGPIPGEPVLHSLLTSGNETIGYLLLKNMGIQDKIQEKEEIEAKIYGCEMPKSYEINSKTDESNQYIIPDIYKEFLTKPKDNSFGLGYSGLDKSHINLFTASNLVIREKNKKKLSISGQAFGVGAFEDDDEDIYVKDDMTRYDFEMTNEKEKNKTNLTQNSNDFIHAKNVLVCSERFPSPVIPHSFTGKHKLRKSRFEPLPEENIQIDRREINPDIRAKYLGEESNLKVSPSSKETERTPTNTETVTSSLATNSNSNMTNSSSNKDSNKSSSLMSSLLFDRFVSASQPEDDPSNILEAVKPMETTHGTEEMKGAVKLKMFGPLTRISIDWQPCPILCKRFNVPEPHFDGSITKNRKRTKPLIFQYQQHQEEIPLKPGLTIQTTSVEIEENINQVSSEVVEESKKDSVVEVSILQEEFQSDKEIILDNFLKDETEKVDVAKNLDLFREIFLSSSESEEEEEEETEKKIEKNEELKNEVLSDNFLPKIKTIKQGILSNVDFSTFNNNNSQITTLQQIEESTTSITEDLKTVDEESSVALYGPVLPKQLTKTDSVTNFASASHANDSDEWVEKDGERKEKNKQKKKKHKKEKYKHRKKHKHEKKR